MAPVQLDCTAAECKLGDGGGRYKTPEMEVEHALELLKLHVKNHEQQQDNSGYATRVKPQFG